MDLHKNRAWIIDKDKSREFIELFEAHKNDEKRKRFLEECKEIYRKMVDEKEEA
ncbi:hypothetical protein WKH56_20220 [Priestia sp. SB1]|uniref:hypothetical protein n=1 Tax=Priestia sp. SB1 TaxID=3132359 RepID=UPI00317C4BAF